ncbi:SDR family NAD(P)-dependent oxidoreductase [Nocardia sp. XZ_19_385]|uniref:SDR family NAD(P)-dependent oxidoreductase n=1 Tax=Nocardia sp. XZ_19_385 TaxID=2769488 RepID=UPI001E54A2A2|nr:SDR family NAD(P)-dependent oxidoreductase [Nocardia sp. XZ_19_385]
MSNGGRVLSDRRVALITGAGGLLGNAFCQALYTEYDIVAVHRDRTPGVPTQYEWFVDPFDPEAELPENRSQAYLLRADLTEKGEVERVVDLALARFGTVDLLINNAAHMVWHGQGVVDGDAALDDFDNHFRTNVEVPLRLATRLAQKSWLHDRDRNRSRNRNIVNVSSLAGTGVYPGGQALYGSSKAALNHLTRHMAVEFKEFGVRANAIAPDSFPALVPTEKVLLSILELDRGGMTGGVYAIEGPLELETTGGRHALTTTPAPLTTTPTPH